MESEDVCIESIAMRQDHTNGVVRPQCKQLIGSVVPSSFACGMHRSRVLKELLAFLGMPVFRKVKSSFRVHLFEDSAEVD